MRLDNRRYYDEFSVSYERHRHSGYHAFIDDLESSLVRRYVTPSSTVLEAGCGTGLVLSRIAPHVKRAVGVDLSGGMLRQASQRKLQVVQGSVTALPFADASFDMVCSFKVLAHVEQITLAMSELARVPRPGGFLCTEFYNTRSLRYLIKRAWGPRRTSSAFDEGAIETRFITPREAEACLPAGTRLVDRAGIRITTPHPIVCRLPVIGRAHEGVEWALMRSPLAALAGFYVFVVERL